MEGSWKRRDILRTGAVLIPFVAAPLFSIAPFVNGSARAAQAIDQTAFVPSSFVKVGGIEQWIGIKGDDIANPVILVVHGGPGDVQWPFADKYLAWQKFFTVVQWDQRGAGRTYGHSGAAATQDVSLRRIADDGIELAQTLCRRMGKRKIIVLGHSFGTLIAMAMVVARPDLFAATVGTGQVESWKVSVQSQFDLLLAKARAQNDRATIAELSAIGKPDPNNTKQYFAFTRNLRAAMAPSDRAWIASLRAEARTEKGNKDFDDLLAGMGFSGQHLLPDQVASDLPKTAPSIGTAMFVIQGCNDVVTPTRAAADYLRRVVAPYKEFVLIPDAGHFAFLTAPAAFLAALTDKVRPVAIARGA